MHCHAAHWCHCLERGAGDRPLEITAQRAWEAVSWGQKLQLLWLMLRAPKQLPMQLPPPEQALQQLQQLSQGIAPAGMGLPPEGSGTATEALSKVCPEHLTTSPPA